MDTSNVTVRAGDGPPGGRGAWSPRTTLADCWRSRAVAVLGTWLAAMVVAVGGWLLLAPSPWYFGAGAATWNPIATGLGVIALSVSVLVTGPWTRPPVNASTFDDRAGDGP